MKAEFSRQIFENTGIEFHEFPSSGSRFPWGRTDMTNLIVAFRKFAKAPKKQRRLQWRYT
jgi:hypothetical protein